MIFLRKIIIFAIGIKSSFVVMEATGLYKHIVFIMTAVVLPFILKFKEEWIFGMLRDLAQNARSYAKEKLMFLR